MNRSQSRSSAMSSSAPGGSFGRVFGLHGNGSDGSKEEEVEDEEEDDDEEDEEAMAAKVVEVRAYTGALCSVFTREIKK